MQTRYKLHLGITGGDSESVSPFTIDRWYPQSASTQATRIGSP
jgi:hypothetical protein